MSGLFNAAPTSATPSFLGATAAMPSASTLQGMRAGVTSTPAMATESWAPTASLELQRLQQELQRIQAELIRLLASLAAAIPTTPPPSTSNPGKTGGATRFVLSSFNVLSSNAGKPKGFAPGPSRMHGVEDILKANNVSVVGLQEVDSNQLNEFKKIAGDEYGTFKGSSGKRGYHDAVIAWRKADWKRVDGGLLDAPSYGGRNSKVPYVRLKNRKTGQEAYFINAHNPANTRNWHNQDRFRNEAARREAELAERLMKETGLPVFLVGDLNSVKEAHQIITENAPLKAANPRGKAGIDWVFGPKNVDFGKFRRTREGLIGKTTDHPVVFTNVKIGGK